ncbi:MAG TPA: protein phosphatase 2C domain-containing protein [Pirellulaceae bacterium]|jgi:protein phosphatase|nr:protein phosphatase 2C domain-containing protein [Pirellulaceae bacterium]
MIDIDCFGLTHPGLRRPNNQDQFLISELRKTMDVKHSSLTEPLRPRVANRVESGWMLMVADGMGGHAAGDLASQLVVETATLAMQSLIPWFPHEGDAAERTLADDAEQVLERCRNRLARNERRHPERSGMGTTLTVVFMVWPRAFVMHVGDSRCYALEGNKLTQLTKDHTFAQQFIDEGAMSPEQARSSAWAHTLWNVISGQLEAPAPEFRRIDLRNYDALLLCSDGLTKHVSDDEIAATMIASDSAKSACDQLLAAAIEGGGSDNVTVAISRFVHDDTLDLADTGERELSALDDFENSGSADTLSLE